MEIDTKRTAMCQYSDVVVGLSLHESNHASVECHSRDLITDGSFILYIVSNYSLQDHLAKVSGSESCAQIVGRDHRRRSANNLKKWWNHETPWHALRLGWDTWRYRSRLYSGLPAHLPPLLGTALDGPRHHDHVWSK